MADPTATPVRFPDGYGEAGTDLRDWTATRDAIAASPNYLLGTAGRDGRPHLRPVDGVFVDDVLALGGSPDAEWVRNLARRPEVTACLPHPDEAIIIEGMAALVTDAADPLSAAVAAANVQKYPQYHAAGPDAPFRPFWALRPRHVLAWSLTGFPSGATRFTFS